MSLADSIARLRSLNEPVPRPARLPSDDEIRQAETDLGVIFIRTSGAIYARQVMLLLARESQLH